LTEINQISRTKTYTQWLQLPQTFCAIYNVLCDVERKYNGHFTLKLKRRYLCFKSTWIRCVQMHIFLSIFSRK